MHRGRVSAEKVGLCMHRRAPAEFWAGLCVHRRAAVFPGRVPEVRGVMGLAFSTLPGAVWVRLVFWELGACMILWW